MKSKNFPNRAITLLHKRHDKGILKAVSSSNRVKDYSKTPYGKLRTSKNGEINTKLDMLEIVHGTQHPLESSRSKINGLKSIKKELLVSNIVRQKTMF